MMQDQFSKTYRFSDLETVTKLVELIMCDVSTEKMKKLDDSEISFFENPVFQRISLKHTWAVILRFSVQIF